jgi:hypothetical protein
MRSCLKTKYIKRKVRGWDMTEVVDHLPSMHEALYSISSTEKKLKL